MVTIPIWGLILAIAVPLWLASMFAYGLGGRDEALRLLKELQGRKGYIK